MKCRSLFFGLVAALIVGLPTMTTADDSERLVRSVSSPPGETQNPEPEGEHAFIKIMNLHVPSQNAAGELIPIEYLNIDDVLVKTEEKAKPLINAYVYGPVIGFEDFSQSGFPGHGRRDAFGAVSLDDGETWKVTNLSNSADLSSFDIAAPGIPDPGLPHDGEVSDPVVDADTPTISEASYEENGDGRLAAKGDDAPGGATVVVRDANTHAVLAETTSSDGEWEIEVDGLSVPPCLIQAGVDDLWGPTVVPEGVPADCSPSGGELITAYPGDVTNIFHAVAGNKVIAAWQSKYCTGGFPGYTGGSTADASAVADYLGIDRTIDMYLEDMFVVAGGQLSVDYREQEEFAGEYADVGEVPFNCLWSARGVLRPDPENVGLSELVWFQAERLTSGRRDVNRIETSCVAGGGCAISWQEDPEGLRPGEGEGAGTGWAGATTNSQTDIWYSFIEWEDFDIVDVDGTATPLADNVLDTGRPQPYVPMMVPARLSNNARCTYPVNPTDITYCNTEIASAYGIKDQCIDTVSIPLGPQGNLQDICVVDANGSGALDTGDMPNVANTAASRPRLNLQPRDTNNDGVTDDAWVIIVHEEDKGLGRYGFLDDVAWDGNLDNTGTFCGDPDADLEDNCAKADIGKNQWYISFALGTPQTSASEPGIGLVDNLVAQQNQYNAPEVNWRTGTFYPPNSTADMWDFGDTLNYEIFNTEIARRASLMTQSVTKAAVSDNGLVAMPLFKEGIINQGGPADIMARRIVAQLGEDTTDTDGDGVLDSQDNCTLVANPGQEDTDGDGYGNICDADLDNSGYVDYTDLWLFQDVFFTSDPDADLNSSGFVDFADLTLFQSLFFQPPGPSCIDTGDCTGGGVVVTGNPYDFSNMACEWYDGEGTVTAGTWLFTDGSNPYYPKGLCTAPTINLSARTPHLCEPTGDSDGVCPGAADMTCVDDASFGQLCLSTTDPEDNQLLDKLLSWYECPGWNGTDVSNGGNTGASDIPGACYSEPDSALLMSNLDDRSWYNPMEISKAHRGFLDGDFVSMIYAWSPNWKLNAVGTDRYELFVRRSFDGGQTWTVTPASFTASNGDPYAGTGTVTCETWRDGADSLTDSHVCTEYLAGAPEQSRNVSQHKSMNITTLDPRYTPTIASMTEGAEEWAIYEPIVPTDVREPSRFFVVFETGDNTTVAVGEAEPLNLDYGRAEMFGDHYTVWAETDTAAADLSLCYPNNAQGTTDVDWAVGTGFCNEFDTMEGFPTSLSEEASITASAYGDFLYGVWGQFNVDDAGEFVDGDSMFRRIWYLDDYISQDNSWTLPGTQ